MPQPSGFVPVDAGAVPEVGVGILGHGFMGRAHTNGYKKIAYIFWPPAARSQGDRARRDFAGRTDRRRKSRSSLRSASEVSAHP
jgi:hypothetical protein